MNDLEDMSREQLMGEIMNLRKRVSRLEHKVSELSWLKNTDRSGGQFNEWELTSIDDEWS